MKSVLHGMGPVWGRSRKCLALELWPLLNRKLGGQGAKVGLRWGQAFKSPIKQGRIGLKTHFGRLSIPSPVYYSNITSYVTFYYLLSYRYRWGCHPKYIVRFLVKLLVFTKCYNLIAILITYNDVYVYFGFSLETIRSLFWEACLDLQWVSNYLKDGKWLHRSKSWHSLRIHGHLLLVPRTICQVPPK